MKKIDLEDVRELFSKKGWFSIEKYKFSQDIPLMM